MSVLVCCSVAPAPQRESTAVPTIMPCNAEAAAHFSDASPAAKLVISTWTSIRALKVMMPLRESLHGPQKYVK